MRPAVLAFLLILLALPLGTVHAQSYDTLAEQSDPRDFTAREDSHVIMLGDSIRFMGYDIGGLGVRPDGTTSPVPLTPYEVRDALATAQALGGTVLRARPIGLIAGCSACAHKSITHPDPAALTALDLVLKIARDLGLRVIVPLAGTGTSCVADAADPVCATLRGRTATDPAAFFADPALRADFTAAALATAAHVSTLTGRAYSNDPTILAWENCLGCGAMADADAVGAWTEQLGRALKAADPRHLYENGALAGRIGPSADRPAKAENWATPSVDIVGDELATGTDPTAARLRLERAAAQVSDAGKIYVMDNVRWTAAVWRTADDLQTWCSALVRQRSLSGAIAGLLVGHAESGGYLPPPPPVPSHGTAALYFPGITTHDMDAADMRLRGRALRRLAYAIADIVEAPVYLLPPKPEIIGAVHGHVVWRGSAGAARYTIERSADPDAPGSWQVVCDACTDDLSGGWQDPAPTTPPDWYRMSPININGHAAVPSEPVRATP